MSTVVVPKNDTELFKEYYPHIKFLVQRAGIRPDYIEDYAMDLTVKLLKKGLLAQYNPERESEVEGESRTANFKTFLSGFVNSYLRHFINRDRIEKYRSSASSDMTLGASQDTSGVPLLDYLGMTTPDQTDGVEAEELIKNVRNDLRDNHGAVMQLFFEMVLLQVEEHGKVDAAELSEMFGVARQTIYDRLKKLRKVFDKCQ